MKINKLALVILLLMLSATFFACKAEKISRNKDKDVDFTVVAEAEMPTEVRKIVEERKDMPFRVTYSDNQYTYIIIGYGKQKYNGYNIKVKELYESKNALCVKTVFSGPQEHTNIEAESYPYIVIKVEYTEKNVVFNE